MLRHEIYKARPALVFVAEIDRSVVEQVECAIIHSQVLRREIAVGEKAGVPLDNRAMLLQEFRGSVKYFFEFQIVRIRCSRICAEFLKQRKIFRRAHDTECFFDRLGVGRSGRMHALLRFKCVECEEELFFELVFDEGAFLFDIGSYEYEIAVLLHEQELLGRRESIVSEIESVQYDSTRAFAFDLLHTRRVTTHFYNDALFVLQSSSSEDEFPATAADVSRASHEIAFTAGVHLLPVDAVSQVGEYRFYGLLFRITIFLPSRLAF